MGIEVTAKTLNPLPKKRYITESSWLDWYENLSFCRPPSFGGCYPINTNDIYIYGERIIRQGQLPESYLELFYYVMRSIDIANCNHINSQQDKPNKKQEPNLEDME